MPRLAPSGFIRSAVLTAVLIVLAVFVSAHAAQADGLAQPCVTGFAGARETSVGKTTFWNRQDSVKQVVCYGFGLKPSADITVSAAFVCDMTALAIGKEDRVEGFKSEALCDASEIEKDPKAPATYIGILCGWAADALGLPREKLGELAGTGCAAAPVVGANLGDKLESKHELDVARDVLTRGKCLKYSPSHFGSPWLADACSSSDPGFSNIQATTGLISVRGKPTTGFRVYIQGHALPPTLGAFRLLLGTPRTAVHVHAPFDSCELDWPGQRVSGFFFHGYGVPPDGERPDSCATYAGTLDADFGQGWRTNKGLAVGASVADIRALYPDATLKGSTWTLIGMDLAQLGGVQVTELGADVESGRVVTITVAGPEAYDD